MEGLWRIVALACPLVLRRCSRCGHKSQFVCSEKFRVNANGRRVDVWLIYRCAACSSTWNAAVFERASVVDIGALRRFESNDRELAWQYAFDRAWLRSLGVEVGGDVPIEIETHGGCDNAHLEIRFEFSHPVSIRLDRLLAMGLGLSRSKVTKWWKVGRIRTVGGERLRQLATENTSVVVRATIDS